jgi:hypothetical protein
MGLAFVPAIGAREGGEVNVGIRQKRWPTMAQSDIGGRLLRPSDPVQPLRSRGCGSPNRFSSGASPQDSPKRSNVHRPLDQHVEESRLRASTEGLRRESRRVPLEKNRQMITPTTSHIEPTIGMARIERATILRSES